MGPLVFGKSGDTINIATSTQSAGLQIPGTGPQIYIYNNSAAILFIRTGIGNQTAVITDMPVSPNASVIFTINQTDTHIAGILSVGTGTMYATRGYGG